MKDLAHLVLVPSPGVGHLVSAVEIAKLLVSRNSRLSISVLILKFPFEPPGNARVESLSSSISERVKFVELPQDRNDSPAQFTPIAFLSAFFESQKPYVRDAVKKIVAAPGMPRLAGFVLDMFCTGMMDVADEFGVPSYMFFTSGAGFLGLMLHLQALRDERNCDGKFKEDMELDLVVPGFVNPVPSKVLPSVLLDSVAAPLVYNLFRNARKAKGILVNTFVELESNMINSLSGCNTVPPVYPVGPIINLSPGGSHMGLGATDRKAEIVAWLDEQPPSSVVFLCFGSRGSFDGVQVREIACALEQSGVRFLWSLRQPPHKEKFSLPTDYENPEEVLQEGFLNRTAGVGKVIGWAPQVTVLAHPAVGGFVSHCGWNSILESLWYGVPIATWPLYAEQQINAFQFVKELGLAVEIKLDYRKAFNTENDHSRDLLVKAEEIARGIERLMEHDSDIRRRVKEMSEKSTKAVLDGGSSYTSLSHFINDIVDYKV